MGVSKKTVVLAGIAAFTVLAVWIIAARKNAAPVSQALIPTPSSQSSAYQTQTKEGGNVTVIVTPQELATGKPATFQIVFDTHSVNLDFDVAAAAGLRDEQGNTYGPATWKGDPPGGHHREGTLSFFKPMAQTSSATVTLKDIAGIKERIFMWENF